MELEKLLNTILELKAEFHKQYSYWENNKQTDKYVASSLNELLYAQRTFKELYPQEYQNCINETSKYGFLKPLETISDHVNEQYPEIIKRIEESIDNTIRNMIEYMKTQECFSWIRSNQTKKIKDSAQTLQDKSIFTQMGKHFLPMLKSEEMGDLLCLAFTGKLSNAYEKINKLPNDNEKTRYIKDLMAKERVYINWNFQNLSITDVTDSYKTQVNGKIFAPRGLAAPGMIDTSYIDEKNNTLYCTICTSDPNTEKQGSQLFEIYKVLEDVKKNGELNIQGKKNLNFDLILFNRAFFCTQDEQDVKSLVSNGRAGEVKEKEGYHPLDSRKKFEMMLKEPVSKDEMDKINGLTVLSMLGNNDVSYPRFPHTYDICDIIHFNPVTAGSCTMWLYEEFENLKVFSQPKRAEKFFNFLLDFSQETITTLNKIKPSFELNDTTKQDNLIQNMKNSYERTLEGICRNFTSYNLKRDLNQEELEKIKSILEQVNTFNKNHPNTKIKTSELRSLLTGSVQEDGQQIIDAENQNRQILDKKIKEQAQKEHDKVEENSNRAQQISDVLKAILEKNNQGNFNKIFEKIDNLTQIIYSNGRQRTNQASVSNYIINTLKMSKIMIEEGITFTDVKLQAKQLKQKHGNFTSNFLTSLVSTGPIRKVFLNKLEHVTPEQKNNFRQADKEVIDFIKSFTKEKALINVIFNDGFEKSINELAEKLEKLLGSSYKNKPRF